MPPPVFRLQSASDMNALEALHGRAFGPGRFVRTAYRLRERAATEPRLNLLAEDETGRLIGAVQFTPLDIEGHHGGLLLGPLVIDEPFKNQGFGHSLMREGMNRARALGYRLVFLVGDEPYYARAGFKKAERGRFFMPGPVDPMRFLVCELVEGAATSFSKGFIKGAETVLQVQS